MLSEEMKKKEDMEGRIKELQEQNAFLHEAYAKLQKESERKIARLERMLKEAIRRIYGRRSEKINPDQLEFPFIALVDEACQEVQAEESENGSSGGEEVEEPPKPRRQHRGRRPIPKDIPRKREILDVAPEDRICTGCNKEMVKIGEDVTEELDYRPASLFVREQVRPKYACTDCPDGVLTAPLPPRPIEKGRPGPGLLSHVVVSKFADHLPLYRQEGIFDRHGLDLPRSTLSDWCGATADLLRPVYIALKAEIFLNRVVQADESPVMVQICEKPRRLKQAFFWVYGEVWGQVVFHFTLGKGSECPLSFVEETYRGYIQTDGYAGYDALFKRDGVERLGCFAHSRRKFFEAIKNDNRALVALGMIQRLYRIERKAKEAELDATQRLELRQKEAVPMLGKIQDVLESIKTENSNVLPESSLGRAVDYTVNHWDALSRYTEVAEAEIDNNSIENAIRPLALGRKNWLQIGSVPAGERAAILLSLVGSCKRLKIDPFVYLRDVIERIPTHPKSRMAELTPRAWKASFEKVAQEKDPPGPGP